MDIIKGELKKKIEAITKVDNNTILKKKLLKIILYLELCVNNFKNYCHLNKLMVYESINMNNIQNHIIQEIKTFHLVFKQNNILLISEFNNIILKILLINQPHIFMKN